MLEKEDFGDDSTVYSLSDDSISKSYEDAYKKAHFLEVENKRLLERIEVLEGKRPKDSNEEVDPQV